jgi:hypothetical protein
MKRREFMALLGGAVFVPQAALVAGGVDKPHVFEKAADAAAKRSRRRLREETMTATEKAAVRYKMIVALLLSCVSTAGYAQPYFNASGIGRSGCGQYLSAFHDRPPGKIRTITHPEGEFVDQAARYTDWLAGFFTASNWWMARTGKGNSVRADYAIIDVWMKRWCEQNPTKSVLEGAIEYVNSGAN